MKKILSLFLCALLLAGCGSNGVAEAVPSETLPAETVTYPALTSVVPTLAPEYTSRFTSETQIHLSDSGITVNGGEETDAVYTSQDIVYYEDRDAYDSGNPYGEGEAHERHTAGEAAAHTVVNITQPGAYRISGTLSAGQIRVDLGSFAFDDPDAVVELILDNADITCTVAPAILFLNTYECDNQWSAETAQPDVDTTAAGANLILQGENTVTGSHVAKIYKDADGEKKLWKQDGAIYSYMSLNVFGPGALSLTADNEGLDTELHLTVNGGDITIRSDNDGINTNEDGVSVTTINGGNLRILAGLGAEGDGIDSNGYLVINGGTVVASANPAADAGIDSDLGSFIHGGTVIALGSTMDWAESNSRQVTMNLQFAQRQSGNVTVIREDGTVLFAYDPVADSLLSEVNRSYAGIILSGPHLSQGVTCHLFMGSTVTGDHTEGIYDPLTVTGCSGGTQMQYTGTNVTGFGGNRQPGQMPEGMEGQTPPENFGDREDRRPEGEVPSMPEDFEGEMPTMPEGFEGQTPPDVPEGEMPSMPDGFEGETPAMPEGFEGQTPPEGSSFPQCDRKDPNGMSASGEAVTDFTLSNIVNTFSGITAAE